ncbi:putative toxin-antitoxin system toxin component, PIN family [Ottowia sp. SB7-C50]|uniref:putative toxin-antitoxin system toxin component, PIN family n=1 Tax=Ottowia sp. SB7-C50 TaxID=3081231 RepID=UPI003A5B93EC
MVLDTNVVLSALLFGSGRLSALRVHWQSARVLPLVSKATVQELLRVLAYPKFRLTAAERNELLADYLPYAETVTATDALSDLPECRDPKDQMFLLLAQLGRADVLVTGDDDLLHLAHNAALPFAICTPATLLDRLAVPDN